MSYNPYSNRYSYSSAGKPYGSYGSTSGLTSGFHSSYASGSTYHHQNGVHKGIGKTLSIPSYASSLRVSPDRYSRSKSPSRNHAGGLKGIRSSLSHCKSTPSLILGCDNNKLTDEKFASRYASSGSLPETRASGTSSLASSSEDLQAADYKKLYFELKEENDKIREKLRISEENLEKTKEQLQKALQNNSRNEIERKERRSLERKISEMEEELKSLAKVKNENEKLKAENRALTRTVSKLTKKS